MAPDQEASSSDGQVETKCLQEQLDLKIYETSALSSSPVKNNIPLLETHIKESKDEIEGKDDKAGIDDEMQLPILPIWPAGQVKLEWFKVQKVGAGLANLGNTCFLNTVIQCLTYCPPLANYLLFNDHSSSCKCYDFCMMCELQKHMKEALQHPGDVIKPIHIYENLKLIADHFQSGQQEDAHEFLRFVIENLWRASLCTYNNGDSLDPTIRETTIINHIFGGYNRSQVVCLQCNKKSNRYEHFMDFILDIKHNANTLEKALEQFVKPEILEKDNAYQCPKCDILVPAEKTFTIHRAPNVATIQLKRFDYNKTHGGKITKHVSYPEQLDLRPFMSENKGKPLLYRLNAVLVHVGQNCNSGHYFCYIRNSNGWWYLMDDARVQRVGLHNVLNQQAYVLFYVRVPQTNGINSKKNGIVPFGIHRKSSFEQNGSSEHSVHSSDSLPARKPPHFMSGRGSFFDRMRYHSFNRSRFHWNSYKRRFSPQVRNSPHGACPSNGMLENKTGNELSRVNSPECKDRNFSNNCKIDDGPNGKNGSEQSSSSCSMTSSSVQGCQSLSNGFRSIAENDSMKQRPCFNGEIGKENALRCSENFSSNIRFHGNAEVSYTKNKSWTQSPNRHYNGNTNSPPHGISSKYDRGSYHNLCDENYTYGGSQYMYRSASDTNLFVNGNSNGFTYGRKGREPLLPRNRSAQEPNWKYRQRWSPDRAFSSGNCSKWDNSEPGYYDEQSNSKRWDWDNRNGFRFNNKRHSYENNRYPIDKEKHHFRKFHSNAKSGEAFGHPRYHPYYFNSKWDPRLEETF